jgi:hypothetical protein
MSRPGFIADAGDEPEEIGRVERRPTKPYVVLHAVFRTDASKI